ncbi:HK97-gp10 family putative phage morphogenesis protein [Falsihalocynthiibacter arcticus]|uniref:HK97-gp10 family putative phage morphogenesis protein n=1 Tax=Falsihalocynthiibacter arcticus TaxID=1579316 RepID=UPI0030022A57
MSVTVKLEGFSELEKSLEELSQSAGKAVLRRVLKKQAQPMADLMEAGAPRDEGDLAKSIAVSTKLSKRQAGLHRKMFKDDRASVEMFVGAGPLPQAHLKEFGTVDFAPKPFARPAWDADKTALLDRIGKALMVEIDKTVKRAVARAAKAGR